MSEDNVVAFGSPTGAECKAPEFLDTESHKIHAASAIRVWAARTCAGVA